MLVLSQYIYLLSGKFAQQTRSVSNSRLNLDGGLLTIELSKLTIMLSVKRITLWDSDLRGLKPKISATQTSQGFAETIEDLYII